MLFFTHPDKYGAPKDTAWHVGEPVPKLQGVTKVQADCDELELIRMLFSGIPMYTGPVVNWRGDTAVFIYDNLVNYGHKPRELRQ